MIQQRTGENRRGGRFGGRVERKPPEFEQKIIDIRRVARVVKGGRRFNFRVTLVIGNRKGEVGVGTGKADDTAAAIEKAFRNAKKNLIRVSLTDNGSIPCETEGKFGSSDVYIKPAFGGRGLAAGGSVRSILIAAAAHPRRGHRLCLPGYQALTDTLGCPYRPQDSRQRQGHQPVAVRNCLSHPV